MPATCAAHLKFAPTLVMRLSVARVMRQLGIDGHLLVASRIFVKVIDSE